MKSVAFLLLISFQSSVTYAQTAEEVLARYYKSIGGKEKWAEIVSVVEFYDTESFTQAVITNPRKDTGLRFFKKKGQLLGWDRFITIPQFSTDSFTTCFNGEKYWAQKTKEIPEDYSFYKDKYEKYVACGQPCLIMASESVSYVETKDEQHVLKVDIFGASYLYYFNSSSGYLTKFHLYPGVDAITNFKDYGEFGGYLVPYLEEFTKNGVVTRRTKTIKLLVNLNLNDKIFAFPKPPYNILDVPLGF